METHTKQATKHNQMYAYTDSETKTLAEIRDCGITECRKTERDREMERGINQCFSLVWLSAGSVAE